MPGTYKMPGVIGYNKEQDQEMPCFHWADVLVERI